VARNVAMRFSKQILPMVEESSNNNAGGAAGASGYKLQPLMGATIAVRLLAKYGIGSLFEAPFGKL
jgi:hypothetical protein